MRAEIIDQGRGIELWLDDGSSYRFHSTWLRFNAPDPKTISADNGQRLVTLGQLPENLCVTGASLIGEHLELCFNGDDERFEVPLGWLVAHRYDFADQPRHDLPPFTTLWDGSDALEPVRFDALQSSDTARYDWLSDLVKRGVARVSDGPIRDGALFELTALFGYVRETNYGRQFEVRTEPNPSNLAYTGLGLQAHSDNPYRDPSPTVQMLYCLESSATGGESQVVDGFAAAMRLKREDPDAFALLAQYPVHFRYAGSQDVDLVAERPLIELDALGRLKSVAFNNRSMGPLSHVPYGMVEAYFAAYRMLEQIIDDPAMTLEFRLDPGQAFVVDNRRVLHARKAYREDGVRWLQGCYADMDSVMSAWRVLGKKLHANF